MLHRKPRPVGFRARYLTALLLAAAMLPVGQAQPDGGDRSAILPIDAALLESVLAEHRGSVVLVNLWATWCAPCLREVPELVRLESELAERGFRLFGISLDDVDDRDRVHQFRDQYFPAFATYHVSDSDWFALISVIEPSWSSVLPTSFVLDRQGALVATLTGGKDYATFAAAIEPHL